MYIANAKKLKRQCPTIHPSNNHRTYSTAPPQKVIAGIAAATSRLIQTICPQIKLYPEKYLLDLKKQKQRLLQNFQFLGYYYRPVDIIGNSSAMDQNKKTPVAKSSCTEQFICVMFCPQDRALICTFMVYSPYRFSDTYYQKFIGLRFEKHS